VASNYDQSDKDAREKEAESSNFNLDSHRGKLHLSNGTRTSSQGFLNCTESSYKRQIKCPTHLKGLMGFVFYQHWLNSPPRLSKYAAFELNDGLLRIAPRPFQHQMMTFPIRRGQF